MDKIQYSPQVVNSLAKASGLTTQLRKVMGKLELCKKRNLPVPVNLTRKAESLLDEVQKWKGVQFTEAPDWSCPMRFTPHVNLHSNAQSDTDKSPDEQMSGSRWGMTHSLEGADIHRTSSAQNVRVGSATRVGSAITNRMKHKYKKQWETTQTRQKRLYTSS
jgi:hypothetical protein